MLYCMYCNREVEATERDGEYYCDTCGEAIGKA